MKDPIERQDAIDVIEELISARREWLSDNARDEIKGLDAAICEIQNLPTADVPDRKVGKWIPFKARPMDEEERADWSEKLGYDIEYEEAVIYTSQLPDDGQEVLTCSRYGTVRIDRFENDPDYGCYFEENGDMDGIVAWMPLPEPWKGEER